MNILFFISDKVLIAIGIFFLLILMIIALIIKRSGRKVKPISEDERYDNDSIKVTEVTKDELTDEQKEAKKELARVFDQMSADLEKQKVLPDDIDDFEREQEENAIISYQELMAQAEKLKAKADKYEKLAESKADTRVREAMNTYKNHEVTEDKKIRKDVRAFKSSDIVSPIYGIQSNKNMVRQKKSQKSEKRDIISKAYEQDLFEEEKTQNLDFLNSLKEFRKNL